MVHRARPRASLFARVLPALALLAAVGCIQAGRHTAETEETRDLPTVGTRKVSIKTDNGFVRVRPADPGVDTIHIRAEIRALANSEAESARVPRSHRNHHARLGHGRCHAGNRLGLARAAPQRLAG